MDDQTEGTFYQDKELNCCDCKKLFIFTGGEQRFFAEKKFSEPKRCKPCRDAKRAQKDNGNGNGNGNNQEFRNVWMDEPAPQDPPPQRRNGKSRRRNRD